jgi:uncharacterized phage protein gp47/JayE
VVNEPIFFDIKDDLYPLAQPASDIRGITGSRSVVVDGARRLVQHTFQKEVDFLFDEGRNAVAWPQGGQKPEDETIFYVDYFRPNGGSPLSDINVGSVTRTLGEAISREIAMVYTQVNQAYLAGFVDTATGQSLDLVVAILGVVRKTKDYAVGLVTFLRDTAAGDGNITLPEGIVLSTAKGEASFVTTQLRTLQRGQVRIDVPVRASDASKGEAGIVKAGAITTLAQPITGIARVTNFESTILGKEGESDADLRARAKAVLRGLSKATLASLARVIFEGRAKLLEVWDPNGTSGKQSPPGTVILLVESEPERFASLRASVEETRAAGVQTTLIARYVFFKPRIIASVVSMTPEGKLKVVGQIIEELQNYVDGLSAGEPAKGSDLLAAIKKVKGISNALIVDVMAWRSDVGQPGSATLVDALLDAIATAPAGDLVALRARLGGILAGAGPTTPTGTRIPDRGLVQGLSGLRTVDAEIESGAFQVATPDGSWSVALDAEPADIVLLENS